MDQKIDERSRILKEHYQNQIDTLEGEILFLKNLNDKLKQENGRLGGELGELKEGLGAREPTGLLMSTYSEQVNFYQGKLGELKN